MFKKPFIKACCIASIGLFSLQASATTVQFQTTLGNFEVNLYDETTPQTVENFLAYVNSGAYTDSLVHRSVDNFIIQGGGYNYPEEGPIDEIPSNDPVDNEPVYSNVRGTIAMAKLPTDPNSATNEWFINLADNSGGTAQLDLQNSGFTVFGEVMGDGMDVIDAIAELTTFRLSTRLSNVPLKDFTVQDSIDGIAAERENFVIITNVVILDAATDTASDLDPVENTLINDVNKPSSSSSSTSSTSSSGGSSGGGSLGHGIFLLLTLLGVSLKRRR